MLKVLDLFSGIAGNSLALQGMIKTIAYCEADAHARAVILSRMDDGILERAPIFEDVRTMKLAEPVDMIVAGFPCQDISVAGKRAGIREGNRSGLFYEIMRLADEIKPNFLFLENVPAIRTRGLDIVLREITKRGYDCRWTMLSAQYVGAPHKRERWFLLACKSEWSTSHANSVGLGYGKQKQQTCTVSSDIKGAGSKRRNKFVASTENHNKFIQGNAKPRLDRMVNGISDQLVESLPEYLSANYWKAEPHGIQRITQEKNQRIERIKRLGNAVVPLQARTAFMKLMGLIGD